jgi:hypothetical protein
MSPLTKYQVRVQVVFRTGIGEQYNQTMPVLAWRQSIAVLLPIKMECLVNSAPYSPCLLYLTVCKNITLYSPLLHLPPLRSHCVGGCWDRTQNCCDFGIGNQTLLTSANNTPMSGVGPAEQAEPILNLLFPCALWKYIPGVGGGGRRGTYFIYLGRLLARASLHKSLGLDSFPSCAHGCSQKYLIPRSNFTRPRVRIASQMAKYNPL